MNIIITGASRGIGFEMVKYLTSLEGHKVLAISRNLQKLETLQKETAGNPSVCEVLSADLSKLNEETFYKESIKPVFDNVDMLVNNAGLLVNKSFENLTAGDFDLMYNTNVKSVFLITKVLLPYFSTDAHIVNISSMGGLQGTAKFPGLSLYSSSKGAVTILTECMAEEFKEKNIKVNGLALGAAQTQMLAEAFPGYQAPVTARDMAKYIVDFALTGHHFFNGKVLPVAVSTP
jgi:short-subunit dehydrogenase